MTATAGYVGHHTEVSPMLHKANKSPLVIDQGKFVVRAAMPGWSLPGHEDHGYAALALIAESFMEPDTLIGMHPHVQDEIISWVPSGVQRHDDRTHGKLIVDSQHLLVMNAGSGFWHEERTLAGDPPLRMLQIFVRPHKTNLEPMLQHGPLPAATSNDWRLIVGPEGTGSPFFVRNEVYLHDIRLDRGASVKLPSIARWSTYFFVFDGLVEAAGQRFARTEAGLMTQPSDVTIQALEPSVIVAFVLNPKATITCEGSVGDRAVRSAGLAQPNGTLTNPAPLQETGKEG